MESENTFELLNTRLRQNFQLRPAAHVTTEDVTAAHVTTAAPLNSLAALNVRLASAAPRPAADSVLPQGRMPSLQREATFPKESRMS